MTNQRRRAGAARGRRSSRQAPRRLVGVCDECGFRFGAGSLRPCPACGKRLCEACWLRDVHEHPDGGGCEKE